jgi:transcription antitermination factor NusB
MQALFAYQLGNSFMENPTAVKVVESLPEIDEIIKKNAPKWPIEKINKVDLAILRCAFWELLFQKTTPPKVIIDEAVELAKEFGTQSSSSFVNGVMGTALKQLNIDTSTSTPSTPSENDH